MSPGAGATGAAGTLSTAALGNRDNFVPALREFGLPAASFAARAARPRGCRALHNPPESGDGMPAAEPTA